MSLATAVMLLVSQISGRIPMAAIFRLSRTIASLTTAIALTATSYSLADPTAETLPGTYPTASVEDREASIATILAAKPQSQIQQPNSTVDAPSPQTTMRRPSGLVGEPNWNAPVPDV
jgi:hypothetical protein